MSQFNLPFLQFCLEIECHSDVKLLNQHVIAQNQINTFGLLSWSKYIRLAIIH